VIPICNSGPDASRRIFKAADTAAPEPDDASSRHPGFTPSHKRAALISLRLALRFKFCHLKLPALKYGVQFCHLYRSCYGAADVCLHLVAAGFRHRIGTLGRS
jgi:hypothetical protein